MVSVGDTVFITPVNGQKDYIAVITGPAGAAGPGITEGDYNTWTKEWINEPDNTLSNTTYMDIMIDEKNETLNIFYEDAAYDNRFAIYNLSDFSPVFESNRGVDYTYTEANLGFSQRIYRGFVHIFDGGISQSIQTYLLFLKPDGDTIEVWRSGTSVLWSTNTQTDFGATSFCYAGGISLTGKYILIAVREDASPRDYFLMLYKGSYVTP